MTNLYLYNELRFIVRDQLAVTHGWDKITGYRIRLHSCSVLALGREMFGLPRYLIYTDMNTDTMHDPL